jgi:hypothetical protein
VIWFAVHLDAGSLGDQVTLSRNLSQKGVLLASREGFLIGAAVNVTFKGPFDEEYRTLEGTVVRTSEGEDDRFPYRIAVEFDDPVPELEAALEEALKEPPPETEPDEDEPAEKEPDEDEAAEKEPDEDEPDEDSG